MSMTYDRVARAARIVLRRPLTADEAASIGLPADLGALLPKLFLLDPAAGLDDADKAARAYGAVIDRYDPEPPATAQHWRDLLTLGDDDLPGLIAMFQDIAASGYQHDPAAAPVTADRTIRTVRSADGGLAVLAIGANQRLYLFYPSQGNWTQHDLSAAIPAPRDGHVQAFDILQQADGTMAMAIAVAPRRGPPTATCYTTTGLSDALDAAGWSAAIAAMKPAAGMPDRLAVSGLSLQSQAGSDVSLLVGGSVDEDMNSYRTSLATAGTAWEKIRIPEDAVSVRSYALGVDLRAGLWTLYDIGGGTALIFTTAPDQYGKTINLSYTQMPSAARNFRIGESGATSTPSVFVAGDMLVCYRPGSHANPETVAATSGATLLQADEESVRYVDANGALWRAQRQQDGSWQAVKLADGGAAAGTAWPAPPDLDGRERLLFLGVDGVLTAVTIAGDGSRTSVDVPQRAVWAEAPLSPERLDQAIAGATPAVRFDAAETYLPSSVDFYLRQVGLWDEPKGAWNQPPGTLWDTAASDLIPAALVFGPRSATDVPNRDCDFNLRIPDDALAGLQPGSLDTAPFYVHAKFRPSENVTHLAFWLFYPYNGPGTLKLDVLGIDQRSSLDPLGTHEGDWEHFTIEVDNDTLAPTRIYLSAHDGGAWSDIASLGVDAASGRRVVYASRNGHAAYSTSGDNPSHGRAGTAAGATVWSFALINECSAGSTLPGWDVGRTVLISAPCLGDHAPAERLWLRFPWRWGRYKPVSGTDMAAVIDRVAESFLALIPGGAAVERAIGDAIISANLLGGEGYAAGPGAIKYKDNWFGAE